MKFMAKTRVKNLAEELKVNVNVLIQRLKEDLGLPVRHYLDSLDEAEVERVRQTWSQLAPQVEELRVGDNVKRRRRIAPVGVSLDRAVPEVEAPPEPPPPEETAKKRAKPKEAVARVVTLPAKEAPEGEVPAPPEAEMIPPAPVEAPVPEAAAPEAPPKKAPRGVAKKKAAAAAAALEAAAAPAPAEAPPAPGAPPSSAALKRQRAKLQKKETPARIISMPVEEPAAPAPASQPERQAASLRPAPAKPTAPEEEKKGGKGAPKRKGKRPEPVVVTPAKGKPGKKREVRERADLYGLTEGDMRSARRRGMKKSVKKVTKAELTVPKAIKRRIKVGESITVGELAKRMGIKSGEIIKKLLQLGVMATINYPIDYDSAVIVASDFGYEVERATMLAEELLEAGLKEEGEAVFRPPVVTIMGHVDHGKTSLLDAIRQTRVVDREAGGITQHIGAYHVDLPQGEVVFLDTPGHEAFTAMRARGAQVTDIVVLVVAADDGVMEQTREAINHAKAAGVPLVVAVNKIDKANANPERVKRELAELGVVPEEWGGEAQFAEVSAKQGVGIQELLEKILIQAEMLDLKAPKDMPAQGRIIESRLDKGRGPVGTVLVQKGTLKNGDYFVCGFQYGRVRALFDDRGQKIEQVGPGEPAEIQGLSGVPEAGDEFQVLEDERKVKQIAMMRQQKQREATLARISHLTLDKLYQRIQEGTIKELNLILKADVHGSIEALSKALSELGSKEIKVNLIHAGMGEVTESDIMLASASEAIVVGFNVRANPKAQALAEQEQVDIRYYDIIYNLLKDIHAAMEGLLEPLVEEKVMGQAEVRQVFSITRLGTVAGCMVLDGKIERNSLARVKRKGKVVVEGKINSLKRFKEDAREVLTGYECGIGIEKFNDLLVGDIIEAYVQEKVKAVLEGPAGSREEKSE